MAVADGGSGYCAACYTSHDPTSESRAIQSDTLRPSDEPLPPIGDSPPDPTPPAGDPRTEPPAPQPVGET